MPENVNHDEVLVRLEQVQQAIQHSMSAVPPSGLDYRLSADASLLVDILGEMNYRKVAQVPLDTLDDRHQAVFQRWSLGDGA